jgi:Tol biopolymer transport system component
VSGLGTPCPPTCTGNTVIINPDTGTYRVLASQGFPAVSTFCSIWSPDATHFLCDGENDDNATVNGIYTIRSSDGGGLTRITDAGGMVDVPIDYSPDGRQIVFGRTVFNNCSNRSAIYVVNVDGSGLHRVTPWGFCDDDGSWSPDGSRIAFVKPDGSIFTVHPDGSGLAKLPLVTGSRSFAGDVVWSRPAVGSGVVYVASRDQYVYALNTADGKLLWQVKYSQGRYNAATPIIDGQKLIYAGPGQGLTAETLEKKGDELSASEIWKNGDNSLIYNTPVLKDGLLYCVSTTNVLFCVKADNGQTAWTAPLSGQPGGQPAAPPAPPPSTARTQPTPPWARVRRRAPAPPRRRTGRSR